MGGLCSFTEVGAKVRAAETKENAEKTETEN